MSFDVERIGSVTISYTYNFSMEYIVTMVMKQFVYVMYIILKIL